MSKEAYSHYLLEVKQEYTKQLSNLLVPVIYEGLNSIYKEAKKNNKDSPMKMFQILLSRIPNWNQNIIIGEYNRIVHQTQCDWINDLITAVFISYAKILSSIKTRKKNKTLNLKIPNGDFFMHKAYIECARQFWKNPYLFYDDVNTIEYQRNMREVELIIEQAINETVRKLLPVKNILQQYITIDNESSSSSSSSSSSESEEKEKSNKKKKSNKNSEEEKAKYDEEYITSNLPEKDRKKLEKSVKREVSKAKKDENNIENDDNFSNVSVSHEIKPKLKTKKKQASNINVPIISHIDSDKDEIAEFPIEKIAEFPIEKIAEFPIEQIAEFPIEQIAEFPIEKIAEFPIEKIAEFPIEQIADFPIEQIAEFPVEQIADFPVEKIADFPVEKIAEFPNQITEIVPNLSLDKFPTPYVPTDKEPSKLQEEMNLYKSLDMSNSHNIVLSEDNNFDILNEDISNYPTKKDNNLSQQLSHEYDFPIYDLEMDKETRVNNTQKNIDFKDTDNLSMNTRLDITYKPIDPKSNITKSSEKNIKISIDDIPRLMPNENIKTIPITTEIKNVEITDNMKPNLDEMNKDKKLTVHKLNNLATKRDIKKNYSFF